MVRLTPDPPREETEITSNNSLQLPVGTDSDDEEEDSSLVGFYQMLPTEDPEQASEEEETAENPLDQIEGSSKPSSFDSAVAAELKELWEKPEESSNQEMDPQLKEEVLKAMKGFSLPPSAVPAWASEIQEEDWKQHILDRIKGDK